MTESSSYHLSGGDPAPDATALPSPEELVALLEAPDVQRHLAVGAADTDGLVVQYRIEPGEVAWWWSTRDGKPATGVGLLDDADVVVTCDPRTARGLLDGTLEVSRAFLLGRLRVEGELGPSLERAGAHRSTR